MALQLFGKNKDGIVESGWFEPEESIKKRDNGWVTDIAKLKEEPKPVEPEEERAEKEKQAEISRLKLETEEGNAASVDGVVLGEKPSAQPYLDMLKKDIGKHKKELDKPKEVKIVKKASIKPKKSRKKRVKKVKDDNQS